MRKDSFKLFLFAAIMAFAVLYGMELSSKGIENVNGTMTSDETVNEQTADDDEWPVPTKRPTQREQAELTPSDEPSDDRDADQSPYWDDPGYDIPRNDSNPIVDRVSGTTAQVLHDLSRGGIKFVVSIFESMTE